MSARKAIQPLADQVRDRSYKDTVLTPSELRNVALGLEVLADRLDEMSMRIRVLYVLVGAVTGTVIQSVFHPF